VRLEEHQVAALLFVPGAEEMIEADLEQVRGAGIARDMAPEFAVGRVGPHHHRQRVPAHEGGELLLDGEVAREHRLLLDRDRVDVRRDQFGRPADVRVARQRRQLVQDEAGAHGPFGGHQRQEGVAPFGGFGGIGVAVLVGEVAGDAVVGHRATVGRADPHGLSNIGWSRRSAA
jgi:hypothetical protein